MLLRLLVIVNVRLLILELKYLLIYLFSFCHLYRDIHLFIYYIK